MYKDAVLPAELNDVPHDEEVSSEPQLGDERKLFLNLLLCALAKAGAALCAVALEHSLHRPLVEKTIHRLVPYRVERKLVAHVLHLELEARR